MAKTTRLPQEAEPASSYPKTRAAKELAFVRVTSTVQVSLCDDESGLKETVFLLAGTTCRVEQVESTSYSLTVRAVFAVGKSGPMRDVRVIVPAACLVLDWLRPS